MEGEIWKANRYRMGHTGKAMRSLVDYVGRRGPLKPRDVGAKFGVSLPSARHRLKVALEAGFIVALNNAGDRLKPSEQWPTELLLSGEFALILTPLGGRFLKAS